MASPATVIVPAAVIVPATVIVPAPAPSQGLASRLVSRVLAPLSAAPVEKASPSSSLTPTSPSVSSTTSGFENPLHPAVVPILPEVKNYPWGSPARTSAVAALYARSLGASLDASLPYAELWVGTHASTPCAVLVPDASAATLRTFIQDQVIMVDADKVAHYSSLHASGLPFLLKVLSVAAPLSIQAHPDRALAKTLHARDPDAYADANHKPELAVALGPFRALVGFRPQADIVADIARVPEFAEACSRTVADAFVTAVKTGARGALKDVFGSLMGAPDAHVAAILTRLVKRLGDLGERDVSARDHLLLELHAHYPGDVGCFAAYLLNEVRLTTGQSVFIDANEPHAYLSGDCVEIMATSDNVVRAGLTGKAKDVETLVEMLSYRDEPVEISDGFKVDDYATLYAPPVEEFMLVRYSIPVDVTYELQQTIAPSVIVVLGGAGYIQVKDDEEADDNAMLPLSAGSIYYLKAATTHVVTCTAPISVYHAGDGAEEPVPPPLCFFRAGTNEAAIPSRSNCSLM